MLMQKMWGKIERNEIELRVWEIRSGPEREIQWITDIPLFFYFLTEWCMCHGYHPSFCGFISFSFFWVLNSSVSRALNSLIVLMCFGFRGLHFICIWWCIDCVTVLVYWVFFDFFMVCVSVWFGYSRVSVLVCMSLILYLWYFFSLEIKILLRAEYGLNMLCFAFVFNCLPFLL